jgi:hypothetical protein
MCDDHCNCAVGLAVFWGETACRLTPDGAAGAALGCSQKKPTQQARHRAQPRSNHQHEFNQSGYLPHYGAQLFAAGRCHGTAAGAAHLEDAGRPAGSGLAASALDARPAPELEAKALFEHLAQSHPGGIKEGLLRTFQRRVRNWRLSEGPEKEVFYTQDHKPGDVLAVDRTDMGSSGIIIEGKSQVLNLFHALLPYSNLEWVVRAHCGRTGDTM